MAEKKKFRKVESTMDYWKAENIGDTIEGVYTDNFEGKYGKQPIILDSEKNKMVLPTAKQLTSLMSECKIGDYVRVTYTEDKEVGKASPLKIFTVEVAE